MLTGFPRTRWPRLWFSESYAVRISVKISRICEFRIIMEIMTGLLGCCSSSTLGSRAKHCVKPSRRSAFDCIIRPAPSGTGRTTPSQPGHYPLNNAFSIYSSEVGVPDRWNPYDHDFRQVVDQHMFHRLLDIVPCKHRFALTRLIVSSHRLWVETGKWERLVVQYE